MRIAKKRMEFHGISGTPLYSVYRDMKHRCYSESHADYKHYGARGVTICADWLASVRSFYVWALASGYQKGLTIDRIDNDGAYSPQNCRWATRLQQTRNRSISKLTDEMVAKMKVMHSSRQYKTLEIATHFNISRNHVNDIMRGARWKVGA